MQTSFQISSKIPFEIHLKNDAGKYFKISINKSPTLRLRGPILECVAYLFPAVARCFAVFFLIGTSAGTPKGDLGLLWRAFGRPGLNQILPFQTMLASSDAFKYTHPSQEPAWAQELWDS